MSAAADAQLALALGHARAADAADHAGLSWEEAAFRAFRDYARENATFTTEEVRLWASDIEDPPDRRAWGQIALRARREGLVICNRLTRARSRTVHGMIVTEWRSLTLRNPS